ncbi:hypothetical protein Sango_0111300 [Sesamum angolense]|uniref:Uncharacterized protein n=1 Tax=Sesamum angolense TaxID=2727404 RepID=A0AAE1XFC8_9LAMI|nr:hypothetical protein Sango_0111300 [Sesamum angolense]
MRSLKLSASCATPLYSFAKYAKTSKVNNAVTSFSIDKNEEEETEDFEEYLAEDGEVYQKTLRLVECAMFAAVSGLAFLLSNSLAIESLMFMCDCFPHKYFACFFALPIVLSTMRWGIAAGRKTMWWQLLLFVLSGPVKAITYLLLHGLLGFAMGTFWRTHRIYLNLYLKLLEHSLKTFCVFLSSSHFGSLSEAFIPSLVKNMAYNRCSKNTKKPQNPKMKYMKFIDGTAMMPKDERMYVTRA